MRCVNSIQAKCIEKFRDKNNIIVGYRLVDVSGKTIDVKPDILKSYIKTGKITVVNLTLTSDNRLLSCEPKQSELQKLQKDTVQQQMNKSAASSVKATARAYTTKFLAYLLQGLHKAGISNSEVASGEEIIEAEQKYLSIERYIMLDSIQYNGRDIAVTVLFTNRNVCIDICYSDDSTEIDKTPRLRDKIDWTNISSSNIITMDKLVSCLMTL
jgi:hypothetical protein